ncbi:histone deacetylase family protein [Skermanella pratensis]|uniref:histone deacetylase family protein n=1 Tax=Skermanella pratensis TaxID=2233999 RepID=UPI00130188B5|nr:histone deacetylase family protein [Skermanella pratensis]
MYTSLFSHPSCIDHDTGIGHPECPERLKAVLAALEGEAFHFLDRRIAPRAEIEQLARVHPISYIERVLAAIPAEGHVELDNDTVLCPSSGEAALRAAGAVCAAVDAVMSGEARNAFCATRPPGHHAEAARAMGFCLFNNVAVGAEHARKVHGISRVAVIDFDVHHGNGTQDIFQNDPGLFYASTHQAHLYPNTGLLEERGVADNIVNVPLPEMAGSPEFRHAMMTRIFPALEHFQPELIMISAGFDAHTRDPLASLHLVDDDYVWVTRKLGEFAREYCGARIVSTLEGGYDIRALASSCAAHVQELMAA